MRTSSSPALSLLLAALLAGCPTKDAPSDDDPGDTPEETDTDSDTPDDTDTDDSDTPDDTDTSDTADTSDTSADDSADSATGDTADSSETADSADTDDTAHTADTGTLVPLDLDAACDDLATLTLTPSAPTTTAPLVVGFTWQDPRAASLPELAWTVDGTPSPRTGSVIPSTFTAKGQAWEVTATLDHPTRTCEATASVTVVNTPPSCAVAITPAAPFGGDALSCGCADFVDVDGDDDAAPACTWTDDLGQTLGTTCTLPGDDVLTGAVLTCTLVPTDGEDAGTAAVAVVSPANRPPLLVDVSLVASEDPLRGDLPATTLTCSREALDLEGDPLTTAWTWSVSGVEVHTAVDTEVTHEVTLGQLEAWAGMPLTRGDTVGCTVQIDDGVSDGTAPLGSATPLMVGNTPPQVLSVTLADARADEVFTCAPVLADADGDVPGLTITYVWESAAQGVLPGTDRELDTAGLGLDRGDTLTCTAHVDDGEAAADGTSAPATVLNRLPRIDALVGGDTVLRSSRGGTIACGATTWVDGDGDPETTRCQILVDGVEVAAAELGAGETLEVTPDDASWTVGTPVLVRATPWDGLEEGATVESAPPVRLGAPTTCTFAVVREGSRPPGDPYTCECLQWSDDDPDPVTDDDQCRWWLQVERRVRHWDRAQYRDPATTFFYEGCEMPEAVPPAGTATECVYTAVDSRSGQYTAPDVSNTVEIFPFGDGPTHPTPGVTLSPGPTLGTSYTGDLTCSWNDTAVVTSAIDPHYQVGWRVNGIQVTPFGDFPGDPDPEAYPLDGKLWFSALGWTVNNTMILPSGRDLEAGDTIQCGVRAHDGYNSTSWTWSEPTTLRLPVAGELRDLAITPEDAAQPGRPLTCRVEVEPGAVGTLGLVLEADDGAGGWTVVDALETTTEDALELVFDVLDDTPWPLRCRAWRDDGTGAVDLDTTREVDLAREPGQILSVEVTPDASVPCAPRACALTMSTPPIAPASGLDLEVDVQWLVDGVPTGALGTTPVTNPVQAATFAFEIPAPDDATLSAGSTLACDVTVRVAGATPEVGATSAPSAVAGTAPSVADASLPLTVRNDGVAVCTLGAITSACPEDPRLDITWRLDGEVVGTGPTFDTDGLSTGAELTCEVAPVDASGVQGPTTASSSAEIQPGRWFLRGAAPGDLAGLSVASLGDITGDDRPELLIGAPNASTGSYTSVGRIYVVKARPEDVVTDLATVDDGQGGWTWRGVSGGWDMFETWCNPGNDRCEAVPAGTAERPSFEAPLGDGLGTRVRAAGDMDGDGVPDFVVSAPYALAHGDYLAGRTWQISGASIGMPSLSIGQLAAFGGRVFEGEEGIDPDEAYVTDRGRWVPDPEHDGHLSGIGLATADLDGDGYRDLFIGALGVEGDTLDLSGTAMNAGGAWAVRGGPGLADTWLGDLAESSDILPGQAAASFVEGARWTGVDQETFWPSVPVSAEVGRHLVGLGDMDGDGDDEVLVSHTGGVGWDGGWWHENYLVIGGAFEDLRFADPGPGVVVLATEGADYSTSWAIPSALESGKTDWFGMASGVGDVNGDGLADMVIPYTEMEGGVAQSEVAVFFGRPDLTTLEVEGPDQGIGGFVVEGVPSPNGYNIMRASQLGDVDGDGLDDIGLSFSVPREGDHLVVIYGRRETTSLTWDDVLDGSAGYVFDLGTFGGVSDVAGDDVDGDGLGDLIYGKPTTDVDGVGEDAGEITVWFGRDLRGSLTAQGTALADTLTGSPATDRIIGRQGDDLLLGAGGPDVLYGGAGDDTLRVSDPDFVRVDGGLGHDTLGLDVADDVDSRQLGDRVRGIEAIDLGGASITLVLHAADVLRWPDLDRTLTVLGGSDDRLVLLEDGWQQSGTTLDGLSVITRGAATLLVDPTLPIEAAPTLLADGLAIDENSPVGTLVGTVAAVDVTGQPADALVSSGGWFAHDPSSGDLTVQLDELDHEHDDSIPIHVCGIVPAGLETCRWLSVAVLDVPEAPSFTVASGRTSTPEYAPYDTTIAVLAADDPDEDETLIYGWVSEDHVGAPSPRTAFEVDPTTGRVYVVDPASLDFETAPVVEVVVNVTDASGLQDQRTITVDLLDRETQTQVFTVPLISEDELLTPPSAVWDLILASEEGLEELATPSDASAAFDFGDQGAIPAFYLDFSVSGRIERTFEAGMSLPQATIYLPVELSLLFPDDITLGVPFEPTTDWTLEDDAVISGTSAGLDVEVAIGFEDFEVQVDHHGAPLFQVGPVTTVGRMDVELEAEPILGRKLDVLYPNGVSLTDASPPVHLCFRVDPAACPSVEPTCEVVDDPGCDLPPEEQPEIPDGECGEERCYADLEGMSNPEIDVACPTILPDPDFSGCLAAVAEDNLEWLFHSVMDGVVTGGWIEGTDSVDFDDILSDPDTLVVPTITSRVAKLPTDPLQALDALGAPVVSFTHTDYSIPFDSGRADVELWGYWSPVFVTLDSQELYGTRLDGLLGTLTFEGGTTVTAELREGFGELLLPVTEDVDGDGRLDFTLTLEPDASMMRYWTWNVGLSLPTKVGAGHIRTVAEVYDPFSGTTSDLPLGDESFGPLFEDTWEWSRAIPDDDVYSLWQAQGFEPLVLEGTLQLTAP